MNFILKYWYIIIALLYDVIFINTHENEFYTFICIFMLLYYYEFTQESPEKEKKGVETPDLIIKLDHKYLLMYPYWNSIIWLNNIT